MAPETLYSNENPIEGSLVNIFVFVHPLAQINATRSGQPNPTAR